jgi:predicted ATP-grasp superfamily ATP-dependent carboligase
MANVLLVGPWGPLAFAFARSLDRRGLGVYLLQGVAQHPTPRSFHALRGATAIPQELSGTPEGLKRIEQYAREVGAIALAPTVDSELVWLASHRERFEPECRVLVQPAESLIRVLSKRHQIDLARQSGLTVLPTWFLSHPDDVAAIPSSSYPIVLRPDRGGGVDPGFKVRLARSADELRDWLCACTRIDARILAQPYRHLPNLVVHGARSVTGEVIASSGFLVPRKFEGVTLSLEPWPIPDEIDRQCRTFVDRAGITGCYHFDFLHDPHAQLTYFLELNVRMGGTTDKVARADFDEPAMLLQSYGVALPPSRSTSRAHRRVVNKRVLLKHIAFAASGRLTPLDYPDVGRLAHIGYSVRDLVTAKDSIFDWRDVGGSVRFHLRGLSSR